MYTRILKKIPKLKVSLVLGCLGALINSSSFAQNPEDYNRIIGSARAQSQIVDAVGNSLKFNGVATSPLSQVAKYEWDFDGDGTYDWSSESDGYASHVYNTAGTYSAYFKATEVSGEEIPRWKVNVYIVENQSQIDAKIEEIESQTLRSVPPAHNQADGIEKRYALIINGNPGSKTNLGRKRFWDDMVYLYDMLLAKGFTDENIYMLYYDGFPEVINGHNVVVDGPGTKDGIRNACNTLAGKVDEDDILYVWTDDHGHGYSRVFPLAPTEEYVKAKGHLGSPCAVDEDDEKDELESEFKVRGLCTDDPYNNYENLYHGLNTWRLYKFEANFNTYFMRIKYVSEFPEQYFKIHDENLSNNDPKIEKFVDYMAGDINHDGVYSSLEDWDINDNGITGYDPINKVFDEEDWGPVDRVLEYNTSPFILPEGVDNIRLFDAGGGKLAVDLNPSDIENGPFEVDAIDNDNDGLFDKMDVNMDGDFDDWVSIDETLVLYDDVISDDELKAMLEPINPGATSIIMFQCFSGGFVEDLSKPGTVIMCPTEEDVVSWGNNFIRNVITAFSGINYSGGTQVNPTLADLDSDGKINMLEAYLFAARNDQFYQMGMEFPVFDDNADKTYTFETNIDYNNLGDVGRVGRTIFIDENVSTFHNIPLQNLNVSGTDNYAAGITATVENSYVNSGSTMNILSGKEIRVLPNFHAQKGSSIKLKIE